ncbi:MAG: type II secretion system F family protein [Desulfuromonadaceae bacterium]|nr:type II secretion system F family protein [Desulfuromonadaceae bacterium]MDD5104086.1 type II secretion system F family protein [Desulfuromonadaceae bacterium]
MKFFAYHATDYSGKILRGSIASETADAAYQDLSTQGLYVISIRETAGQLTWLRKHFFLAQVKRTDILEFTGSLSIMLLSGVPIINCMNDVIGTTSNASFKPILREIRQRLESGSSVTEALEAQGKLFPEVIKTLVAVGEETSHLGESLKDATEHLQRMQNLSDAIKKALMYPAFALIATLGALTFWMLFVIPALSSTLKGLGVKLPMLTVLLINSSSFFKDHWNKMAIAAVLLPFIIHLIKKQHMVKYYLDRTALKLPILQVVTFNKLLATFAEQFRMLTAAGIPIHRLFDLLIPAIGNEYFGVNLVTAKENILNGVPISESLERQKIVPVLVISKIHIGEVSGTLDKQLDFLAKYYTKKLDDATEKLSKVIEPLVMVVIGGLFAIIIMGLLLPVYDLVSQLGRS